MDRFASLLLATALLAGPASAEAPMTKDDPDKIICKTEFPVGSRLGRKRCVTAARWAELRRESREWVEIVQRPGSLAGAR